MDVGLSGRQEDCVRGQGYEPSQPPKERVRSSHRPLLQSHNSTGSALSRLLQPHRFRMGKQGLVATAHRCFTGECTPLLFYCSHLLGLCRGERRGIAFAVATQRRPIWLCCRSPIVSPVYW